MLGERAEQERATDQQKNTDGRAAQSVPFRSSAAIILADADQLEALARLRFEPRSTDELGALVAAHAAEKPWLVAGVRAVLEHGSPGLSDQPAEAGQPIRESWKSVFSPELKAGLATLTSVDDAPSTISGHRAGGLTNAEELWSTLCELRLMATP